MKTTVYNSDICETTSEIEYWSRPTFERMIDFVSRNLAPRPMSWLPRDQRVII